MKLFFRLLRESFIFSFNAIIANPVRTILSLLGVTIGIFTIIAVLSTVDSLEKSIKDNLSFLGTDNIRVEKWPWDFDNPSYEWWKFWKRPEPTYREYEFLKDNLPSALSVEISTNRGISNVKYLNNSSSVDNLNGVVFENQFFNDWDFIAGRFFTQNETIVGLDAVIIGYKIMEDLFRSPENAIGKQIKIKGRSFTVIGVQSEQGESFGAGDSYDRQMSIPFNTFKKIFRVGRKGSNAVIRIKGDSEIDPGLVNLEYEVKGLLRAKRGLKPIEEDNFAINRPEYLASFVSIIFGTISIAGWVIASFSILVGGFGIANIMFVSVKERVPIIGLQKSLGAKKYFILTQFLFESSFLSIFGGLIGIFLVFLITLPDLGSFDLIISLKNVIIGVSISSVIGILAGFFPALFASNLDPVEAIRSN
ncbi:MAG: ABC transporter [Flammeovirgaceae bacterium]|nr:ABC transporter [Flammeovirgaceae bacterium]|tara:strand:- start:467 stop:1726 length:1260 start_codon:yes stop_codon:yes gene_type:complete